MTGGLLIEPVYRLQDGIAYPCVRVEWRGQVAWLDGREAEWAARKALTNAAAFRHGGAAELVLCQLPQGAVRLPVREIEPAAGWLLLAGVLALQAGREWVGLVPARQVLSTRPELVQLLAQG